MTKFNKCTCVKVNKEKMDLIKAKGLNLQDILDKAMDNELKLNKTQSIEDTIDEINTKIEKLEKQRDAAIIDCEKKINILMKNLSELKHREEKNFNKEINFLKLKREYLLNNLE
ncbi:MULTISPECIES: hypothetical protein [Methanosphaera]|uniref:Uncharacterized protein n=4 Tax=Methanosphaera stadtmanae TaxID=2317 RepID=Q2NFN6_METST|nr:MULTISPECIES: hypothetical protein [Methanosphaera]ABC57367.1 hypothetical protein Msp_0979 [Methanosphaera stadtmanae DSM 3091]MEE0489642.1 hypothetical protein [Methanosphaera stadtmanae]RAP02950.1 hypothetical protein CA615_04840 [Methanosphaera stadtmanae]RAP47115.1 MAG: hypothetical protein BZ132_04645 [Methanosphaera sp. DEW79]